MMLGIVGVGFVGLSLAAVLAKKNNKILIFDIDQKKIDTISSGKSPFYEPFLDSYISSTIGKTLQLAKNLQEIVNKCDFIFLTVGTPTKDDKIDLTNLKKVAKQIGLLLKKSKNIPTIVIKSTVTPGTNQIITKIIEKASRGKSESDFYILSNPEFLREGKAVEDTLHPHIVVIGGRNKNTVTKLKKFYQTTYNSVPYITTNTQTAEMIKYANNSFLATKISFINQIANLCENIPGTNVDDIASAIGLDPRIGNQFLKAGPGYGGSCLPKDLNALISFSKKSGQKVPLLEAVQKTNIFQVENTLNHIKKATKTFSEKTITVLGLSFKEDSDDIRESVSINLIKKLLKENAKVVVHDPMAINNTKKIFGNKIRYAKSVQDALKNSSCAVIMTPWKEYAKVTNKDLKEMKKRVIVDTRRILNPKKLDVEYIATGVAN